MYAHVTCRITYEIECPYCDERISQSWVISPWEPIPLPMPRAFEWNVVNGLAVCPKHPIVFSKESHEAASSLAHGEPC